jgi:hypothetical protein
MKSVYDMNEEERALALYQMVHSHTLRARSNIGDFFSYVMRDEDSLKPVMVAPHQKVIMEFALAHDRSVIMVPADHGKTFTMAGITLFMLGHDPTLRGAVVSATGGQAGKPVDMVRSYIDSNPFLHSVFPALRRSPRQGDPWTSGSITVARPPGIRDPSLRCVGIDGSITGSRLNWCIVDDILNRENTATQHMRRKVHEWFDSTLLSRMVPGRSRVTVTNTAWHPEDLPHQLEATGWPTLRMSISGNVIIRNTDWDTPDLRPAYATGEECRLTAYDPDPDNAQTLWPFRYDHAGVEKLRREHLPHRFNQLYEQECRDDATAKCKQEWIDNGKRQGAGLTLVSEYTGDNITFTGVDLAIQPGEEHDDCAFFTFEQLPNGKRRILDIEIGQFDGPTIVDKLFAKAAAYKSILRVENNAAQDFIRQFALQRNASLPIKPHTTGRGKAHPEHGIEGLFIELSNGAWIIPCDHGGRCHPSVQKWIDGCLYYVPSAHTDDSLMASYFAREQAKAFGLDTSDRTNRPARQGSLGGLFGAR